MYLAATLALVLAKQTPAETPTFGEVTIYNQGFGLIKDVRKINLKSGRQTVAIEDVAAMIEPNSVAIHSISAPDSFEVLEQNYQYDLISPIAILNKAVGQHIRFLRVLPNGQKESLEGVLLSSPTAVVAGADNNSYQTYNGMVIRTDDGRIILNPNGEIEVSSLPEGLISKPTLLWDLDSKAAGSNTVELSYLTRGMTWNADYVLTLDSKDNTAGLQGWVTVNNESGATFKNAKMKLLAGDVNRVQSNMPRAEFRSGAFGGAAKAADQFNEQSLFEYHLYTLQRPATIRNKETKQISLLESPAVKFEKKVIVDSLRDVGMYYPSEGEIGTGTVKPQVRVEFVNSKENGLAIPLPKGNVKVYQRDASGSVQMLGEDSIDHTPKEERVSLVVGRSFDIAVTRKRLNFHRISDRSFEETFEIEVRNRKDVADTVYVLERHYADWKVTQKSMDFTKLDSQTMQFVLKMPANSTQKVTYTVVTTW